MEHISDIERRRAFSRWLRTGHLTSIRGPDGIERKFNPWHDPDTGRFTFANTGVYHARGGGGGGARSSGPRSVDGGGPDSSPADDLVITAKRQTVDDVGSLSDGELDGFERAAKAGRWTERRENREIHEYARLKRAVAARAVMEKRGERDWAKQGRDFGRLYGEALAAEALGVGAAKFVVAPAIRKAAPIIERVLRPQAYARKLADRTPLPPAPKPIWVDENATMNRRARTYNDGAPGARSNPLTKRGQAPALYRTTSDGKRRLVRFDGYEGGRYPVYIDRKTGLRFTAKSKDQVRRQSAALRENNAVGRWDVPDQATKKKALKLLKDVGIDNIGVKVVPI